MVERSEKNLGEAFFPVEIRDIFIDRSIEQNEKLYLPGIEPQLDRIADFKAVCAIDNGHVFSVVTKNYKLVSTEEAFHLGQQCFMQIFKLTSLEDMEYFSLVMPMSRSFCHMNFVHKNKAFSAMDEMDRWFPFLRVTNSYNRTYALSFDLGFCRGACKNGVFFGKRSINFKYFHNRSTKDVLIEFSLKSGAFGKMEKAFLESLYNLKRYWIPEKLIWPMVAKVFRLQVSGFKNDSQKELFRNQKSAVSSLSKKYCDLLGENGYATLNVLSDFATRPIGFISSAQKVDGFQRRTGEWIREYLALVQSKDFSFDDYLKDYLHLVA